jgi:hypothetical protein
MGRQKQQQEGGREGKGTTTLPIPPPHLPKTTIELLRREFGVNLILTIV